MRRETPMKRITPSSKRTRKKETKEVTA